MIIAIDGPSGSGKSTISKILAKKLNMEYINTGAMYRAVTYYFIKNNLEFSAENIDDIDIDFMDNQIMLNGENVEKYIRTSQVSKNVSQVSANEHIRKKLVNIQRQISKGKSVVLDGRDIGTAVFPNADFKIYLSASIKCRAMRRYNEIKDTENITYDEVCQQIKERDYKDSTRKISPLKKAEDAVEIDTSHMSIDETVKKIIHIIEGKNNV